MGGESRLIETREYTDLDYLQKSTEPISSTQKTEF